MFAAFFHHADSARSSHNSIGRRKRLGCHWPGWDVLHPKHRTGVLAKDSPSALAVGLYRRLICPISKSVCPPVHATSCEHARIRNTPGKPTRKMRSKFTACIILEYHSIDSAYNAVATRTDFLVLNSDWRLLAGRQRTSYKEVKKNEHAHSVRFSRTTSKSSATSDGQHLGRRNQRV